MEDRIVGEREEEMKSSSQVVYTTQISSHLAEVYNSKLRKQFSEHVIVYKTFWKSVNK